MPIDYLPILILLVVSTAMAIIAIVLSAVTGPRKPYPRKLSSYESGMPPVGDTCLCFHIRH